MLNPIFDKKNLQQSAIADKLRDLFEEYANGDSIYDISYYDEDTENPRYWVVNFIGPQGTPYENGLFRVRLEFKDDYPHSFPEPRFLTKIYHCHVKTPEEGGDVCLGKLTNGKNFNEMKLDEFLDVLYSIFYNETPNGFYGDRHQLITTNKPEFHRIAKEWTQKYALFN